MTSITSQNNPRLKELRKLHRRRERDRSGLFLAEGEDLIAAAILAGRPAVQGYRLAGTAIGGAGFHDLDGAVLASVSTLGSGTRAIGVYEQRFGKPTGPLCVYLHGVSDPGNVGTVLRSALAFGASCVALGPGCADPHSPKAVRASMGAIFAVALAQVKDVSELPGERCALVAGVGEPIWRAAESIAEGVVESAVSGMTAEGMVESAADGRSAEGTGGSAVDGMTSEGMEESVADGMTRARARVNPSEEHQTPTLTLLVGAEREGLPEELVKACERVVDIPIASESLNAAMAATVALYELTRPSTRVSAS